MIFVFHTLSAMTIADLKELSPFLAIIVSMLALTIGPFISGRVARAQAIASMREMDICVPRLLGSS